jgi:putative ABC transport system ATP-binding protein
MTILELNNVEYEYRNRFQTVRAVGGVSMAFEQGKLYALVGKSGSGKTTLLSLLAGLDLPTAGDVRYRGGSTREIDADRYRRDCAAVIYQSFNLFAQLTVLENVMTPLILRKAKKSSARAIAAEKLTLVGLDEKYHRRFPNMLSGGEQQRVAIARALAGDSEVILADEPTGNLDSGNSAAIIDILTRFAHEFNVCVIVVTHDPAVAARADVVVRMGDGLILQVVRRLKTGEKKRSWGKSKKNKKKRKNIKKGLDKEGRGVVLYKSCGKCGARTL